MARKRTDADLVNDAFDHLIAIQDLIFEIADVEPTESSLRVDERFPESFFYPGECEEDPERGELAIDTHMSLSLTEEQARELVGDVLNALRDQVGAEDIKVELDGRFFMKGKPARETRRALLAEGEGD